MDMIVKSTKKTGVRVSTFDLWEKFGYTEHRLLKRLISDNLDAFESIAPLVVKTTSPGKNSQGGRPDKSYMLTDGHVVLIAVIARQTSKNKDMKTKLIGALLNGKLDAAIQIIQDLDVSDLPPDRFVYVAVGSTTGSYKIGISKHPVERVKQLNVNSQEEITLVMFYRATEQGYQSERIAHELYKNERIRSEWFSSSINLGLLQSNEVIKP